MFKDVHLEENLVLNATTWKRFPTWNSTNYIKLHMDGFQFKVGGW